MQHNPIQLSSPGAPALAGSPPPRSEVALSSGRRLRRLSVGFAALTAATYALVVLGALVRAHGAGLACPDWPLCFGEVIPRFDLKVAFEWGHRAVAGGVALAFLGLSVAALRVPGGRAAVGGWLAAAALALAVQVLLGALTVWHLLASWTVTSHLVTGNAIALLFLLVALRLREASGVRPVSAGAPARARAWVTAAAAGLALQMVLGGLVASRFVGLACPEWPTCADGVYAPAWTGAVGLHVLHRTVAYGLVATLGVAAVVAREVPRVGPLLAVAALLSLAQAGVGVANVLLRIPVEVTGLHSALAAALVLCVGCAAFEAWRRRA